MSEIPPPSILDYQPEPPAPQSRAIAIAAWCAIWLMVVWILVAPWLTTHKSAGETSPVQFEASARYAVGVRTMLPTPPEPLLASIDKVANSPAQKLYAAIVAGELQGGEQALKRLDSIRAESLPAELKDDTDILQQIYTEGPDSIEQAQRQRLLERHDYFGQLALSFKRPATDPLRGSVLQASRSTAITLLVTFGVVLLLGIVGLALLIVAIVLFVQRTLRCAYQPKPGASTVYLEMFALYLLSYMLLSRVLAQVRGDSTSLAWYWCLSIVLPIALGWGLLRGLSWNELRRGIGWHGSLVELPMGVIGYIAGVPVIVVGFIITLVLFKLSGGSGTHPIEGASTDTPSGALQLYGIACIFAPIVEETMFRGALFHYMRRRWSWLLSAALVSFIFAAIHPQGWAAIPVLASIAIVLAAIREWRGSIIAPMVAHAFSNGMVVTLLLSLK